MDVPVRVFQEGDRLLWDCQGKVSIKCASSTHAKSGAEVMLALYLLRASTHIAGRWMKEMGDAAIKCIPGRDENQRYPPMRPMS